jgi:hypothetical protein
VIFTVQNEKNTFCRYTASSDLLPNEVKKLVTFAELVSPLTALCF